MINYKDMTPDEKRDLIDRCCGDILMRDVRCVGCPFEDDPLAWCNVGFIGMISDDALDSILEKFFIHDAHQRR